MSLKFNAAESDALVRSLDGLTDDVDFGSVTIERRDSLDNPHDDGFLIVHVAWKDGGWTEDAISETGSTSHWAMKL